MKKTVMILALLALAFIVIQSEDVSAQMGSIDCSGESMDGLCDMSCYDDPDCCVSDGNCRALLCSDDPDCAGSCTKTADYESDCTDNIDNDCDGDIDEADSECPDACHPYESDCTDGVDNNCDGDIDEGDPSRNIDRDTDCPVGGCSALDGYCDPNCPGDPDCTFDNTCDYWDESTGHYNKYWNPDWANDCLLSTDTNCRTEDVCPYGSCCTDGEDNDCDGLTDDEDPNCCVASESPETSCSDGTDNDCDGLTDGSDPDCGGGSCGTTTTTPCTPVFRTSSGGPCDEMDPNVGGTLCACSHSGTPSNTCSDNGATYTCDTDPYTGNPINCECVWDCDAGESCSGSMECDPDLYCNSGTYCIDQAGPSTCGCTSNSDCCIPGSGDSCFGGNCYNSCEQQGSTYLCTPDLNTYETEITNSNIACPTLSDYCVTCPSGYTRDRVRNQCVVTVCDDSTEENRPCAGAASDAPDVENTDGYYCDDVIGDGHCCRTGWYWDGSTCTQSEDCYDPSSSGDCNYDFATQETQWWTDPNCYITSYTPNAGCCYAGIEMGEERYTEQDVVAY